MKFFKKHQASEETKVYAGMEKFGKYLYSKKHNEYFETENLLKWYTSRHAYTEKDFTRFVKAIMPDVMSIRHIEYVPAGAKKIEF